MVEGEQSLELHGSGLEPQLSHSSFTLNDLLTLAEVPHLKMKTRSLPSRTIVMIIDKKYCNLHNAYYNGITIKDGFAILKNNLGLHRRGVMVP